LGRVSLLNFDWTSALVKIQPRSLLGISPGVAR
jgi:hypothetical protein